MIFLRNLIDALRRFGRQGRASAPPSPVDAIVRLLKEKPVEKPNASPAAATPRFRRRPRRDA